MKKVFKWLCFICFCIVLAPLLAIWALLWLSLQPSSFEAEGERLARSMIKISENGTKDVTMKKFADEVCFLSEGTIYAPAAAEHLFPDFTVEYVERFQSHGVWFIVAADAKSRTVKIYPVQQALLSWPVAEDLPPAASCPTSVSISFQATIPEIDPRSPRSR